jgi:hypothetical protein
VQPCPETVVMTRCSGTTTCTPTTSSTTTAAPCPNSTCRYTYSGASWLHTNNGCITGCECDPPAENTQGCPGQQLELPCRASPTTTTTLGPCGFCRWDWVSAGPFTGWVFTNSTCLGACACPAPPTIDGADGAYFTSECGTTTTTTTTTTSTTTTTTAAPTPCGGDFSTCTYLCVSGSWTLSSTGCDPGCVCSPPGGGCTGSQSTITHCVS